MNTLLSRLFILLSLGVAIFSCQQAGGDLVTAEAVPDLDALRRAFTNPPSSAKPRTWFHAMSGNMSKAGLTKDLEAIAEVGIGGVLLFNVTQGIPNGDIIYDSEEHHAMISHAAAEAERLGLSFGVHNCDGWSSSGGPWITPELSMKMVVWSDTVVSGGGELNLSLARPTARHDYYEDIAVVAYPALESEQADQQHPAVVRASSSAVDLEVITNGRIDGETLLPAARGEEPWLEFAYAEPHTVRSAEVILNNRRTVATLLSSDDGKHFREVKQLKKFRTGKNEWVISDHFPAETARYFRLQFDQEATIKEARLLGTFIMHNRISRTARGRTNDNALRPIGMPEENMIVRSADMIDLSAALQPDGRLKTTLPPGAWTIMRFGQTTTGAVNIPSSAEGKGLEADKLSRAAFKVHYDNFVGEVVQRNQGVAALQYAEIDSYEMGGQNWTDSLPVSFAEEMGYDLKAYLPLFAGRFVDDAATSEAVLADLRRHISDLMKRNYFQYFTELCNRDGLLSYIEPYGNGVFNDLDVGGVCDIPMGEFWEGRPMTMVAPAVSSAHIYGKPVISAESFTSNPRINWKGNPAMVKIAGDQAWAAGINEFMFHRFAHQANTHVTPGMTMNRWGFHFDRTQTWWFNAGKDWFAYMARGQYLLRQGVPVSDLAVFVGDGAPSGTYRRNNFSPAMPLYLNYDCINAEVLQQRAVAREGKLVLPEGTTYRVIMLQNSDKMTLPTLRKLQALAAAGVPITGDAPTSLLGFRPSPAEEAEFAQLRTALQKHLLPFTDWETLWEKQLGIAHDLRIAQRDELTYAHRSIGATEAYFIYNPDTTATELAATFRVTGLQPEIWYPLSGEQYRLAEYADNGTTTELTVVLEPQASAFIVFRVGESELPTWAPRQLAEERIPITGPWAVSFAADGGYEKTLSFPELTDWSTHPEEGIRYYSGTATYRKTFSYQPGTSGERILLELGEVDEIAEVWLNGTRVGIDWLKPFTLEVTEQLKTGENTLEIAVTNLWSNRLIGEERYPKHFDGYELERKNNGNNTTARMVDWYKNNQPPPPGPRTTFTTSDFYEADDPLLPSGLKGPVYLRAFQ